MGHGVVRGSVCSRRVGPAPWHEGVAQAHLLTVLQPGGAVLCDDAADAVPRVQALLACAGPPEHPPRAPARGAQLPLEPQHLRCWGGEVTRRRIAVCAASIAVVSLSADTEVVLCEQLAKPRRTSDW